MSIRRTAVATTVGLVAAGAATAGIAHRRRVSAITRRDADVCPAFGSLRAKGQTVIADDGTPLYVEVDEVEAPKTRLRRAKPELTLVFCHGYALNLDCWHFQREHYRSLGIRTVFYDQRSHGRSGRSPMGNATIDHLGSDLLTVLDAVVPEGPVVLVGHSMGGMTVIALAEQHPELFGDRIVGTALISTTAGGLDPSRILFPMVPTWAGSGALHRGV